MKIISLVFLISASLSGCISKSGKVAIPAQKNEFTWIYNPAGDIFPGPATKQLEADKNYEVWVPNDHAFVKDTDGKWHIFGITHPITGVDDVHEGEVMLFHAKEPECAFLSVKEWKDLPKVLPPSERPGEPLEIHAPCIIRKDELYYMFYGPAPIRLAVSRDLMKWESKGNLFSEEKGARDPDIICFNNHFYIVYCTEKKVNIRTSDDLIAWSDSKTIYESVVFDPESPSIIRYNNSFYLFVCAWDGIWDKKDIQGAYQHKTYVYNSKKIDDFGNREPITILNSHAPEVFEYQGNWYISSAEWPNRGISLDKLRWE